MLKDKNIKIFHFKIAQLVAYTTSNYDKKLRNSDMLLYYVYFY